MTFALITEGISEYMVIRHLLSRYFKDDNPIINQIQPKTERSKQISEGGWNEVLKYCEREELTQILVENDYVILQIDTDQSQQSPFDVPHLESGKEKSAEKLFSDITERLKRNMPENIPRERIIFAICIHTVECWLLPLFCTDGRKEKIKGCLPALNQELRRRNMPTVSETGDKNSPTSQKAYREILRLLKKKSDIEDCAKHNFGFQRFIHQLGLLSNIKR